MSAFARHRGASNGLRSAACAGLDDSKGEEGTMLLQAVANIERSSTIHHMYFPTAFAGVAVLAQLCSVIANIVIAILGRERDDQS